MGDCVILQRCSVSSFVKRFLLRIIALEYVHQDIIVMFLFMPLIDQSLAMKVSLMILKGKPGPKSISSLDGVDMGIDDNDGNLVKLILL